MAGPRKDIDLNDIVVFNAVVAAGSFGGAARALTLPASAVSRRIARLEECLGFTLLRRTTRSVGLTDAGRVYFERTTGVLREVEAAARAMEDLRETPSGVVRITAPPDEGGVIWALLEGFLRSHPNVDLEVTHTLDYVDLIAAGIDVALRGGTAPDSTEFIAHPIFESRILLAASPAYLEQRGTPREVDELGEHDCINMDTWAPNIIQSLKSRDGSARVRVRNRLRVNRLDTAHQAALAGLGIAPLLLMTCRRDLEQGSLVEVLPGTLPPSSPMWVVYPSGRNSSAAAQALIEHIRRVAPRIAPDEIPTASALHRRDVAPR